MSGLNYLYKVLIFSFVRFHLLDSDLYKFEFILGSWHIEDSGIDPSLPLVYQVFERQLFDLLAQLAVVLFEKLGRE